MELKIELAELRKRSLFVATPMYGGACHGIYAKSIADLTALCQHHGIRMVPYFMFNESLIQRARNYCCDEFMRSDLTHMLFIDSDIGFNANDVIAMLALMSDESPYDVMAAPYPKKCISWEKIKKAVDKGVADQDPNKLEDFVGDFVFNPIIEPGKEMRIPLNEPAEVAEAGTGFMMIKRKTFENYGEAYPHLLYLPDHVRTEHFDGSREIMAYFDCIIDPESKRYLSEDYFFCQYVRRMGGKVWFCPWMKLLHVGSFVFGGNLAAMAAVGASPTADGGALKKIRDKSKAKAKKSA